MTEALYNPEAESLFLAAVLRNPDDFYSLNSVGLSTEDFLGVENKRVAKAIFEVVADKGKPDLPMVLEALRLSGHSDTTEYVTRLTTLPCSVAQAHDYARVLRGLGISRQIGLVGAKMIELSRERRSDYESTITEAQSLLHRVTDTLPEPDRSPRPADILRRIKSAGPTPSIPITFSKTLQGITGGLRPGQLWVIGGFSSTGKSAVACNIALDALRVRGKRVAVLSTEMTQEMYITRMLSIQSGVPILDIQNNVTIGLDNQRRLIDAESFLESSNLTVYDTLYKWTAIKNQLKSIKEREGLDLVLLDYIQNVRITGDVYSDSRDTAVESLQLAKELECSFVAFSQVSNEMAKQDDAEKGRGSYYSFKGSGDIRDTADVAIMLRRNRRAQSPLLEFDIVKNRHGMLSTLNCEIDLPTGKIREYEEED